MSTIASPEPFPTRGCAAVVPSGVRTVRAHVVSWIGVTGSCNGLCLVSHGFRVFLVRKRSAAISRHRIPRKLDRKNKETTFLTLATLSLGDNVRPPGQTRLQPPSSPFCVPSASFRLLRFVVSSATYACDGVSQSCTVSLFKPEFGLRQ